MKKLLFLLVSVLLLPALHAEEAYVKEIQQWRDQRTKNLTSEDGWLTLVGLYWLKEGENKMGSDPSNPILLPATKAPKSAGIIHLNKGKTRLDVLPNVPIQSGGKPVTSLELKADTSGEPTVLTLGSLSLFIIERMGRYGVRIKDTENPDRKNFAGLQYFAVDTKWRISAKFEAHKPSKSIPILNIVGFMEDQPSPGALAFQSGGKTFRLDALKGGDSGELFVIFSDETSGKETYGAGRYLYTEAPGPDNHVVLDFNRAYNPPCAFTLFATCPLPPRQNRLALRVEAGEKSYSGGSQVH